MILLEGNPFLRNPISHLSVHTIGLLRLCLNQSPLGPYNPHIMLVDVPTNKIHQVIRT